MGSSKLFLVASRLSAKSVRNGTFGNGYSYSRHFSTTTAKKNGSVFRQAEKFRFNTAIVRKPSSRIYDGLRMESTGAAVDYEKSVEQHNHYVKCLRDIGLTVHILPADDNLPDCIFSEDTAVVIGDIALVTRPGRSSRRGETTAAKDLLSKLGFRITDMAMHNPKATMDGGDILFTGKEIFVGISKRTNLDGFNLLAKTFPMYPATPIDVVDGLHLKSPLSLAGPGRISYSSDIFSARHSVEQIKEKGKYRYGFISCPGPVESGNCLYMLAPKTGKTILYPGSENSPKNPEIFEAMEGFTTIPMRMTEIVKIDGALTCCSLLLVT